MLDLTARGRVPATSYRGDASYYPASVIKAFYLAYYEAQKQARALADTPELVRAVKDMITISSNDATGFVVDSLTRTTSGPELTGSEWESWKEKRNAVNRFFEKRGYRDLNANQKTFCEDAYGRDQVFRDGGRNRNRMTANEVARLFGEIARGEIAGTAGTAEMLALLSRDVAAEKPYEEGELEDARLAGRRLPAGTKMWAKSGDAYDVHHLVARVQLPNGADFVLAVFTKGVKTVPDVIPRVFERVTARFFGIPAATKS
ncbi:MAG: class A beta-lactamase-related serine hydrolase [Acidobacteriota bacterium]|nr:class A beta-lactamase-related serine hydrolase [Acidobacteriota bacterium]